MPTILCKPLSVIVEREMLLQEAIIVNPQAITQYVDQFARTVRSPEGKAWFQKKLRAWLINSPTFLYQVTHQSREYPDYANKALEQGQPAYQFNPDNTQLTAVEQTFHHISDWFNAMADIIARKPTNDVETHDKLITEREFSKIMHYNPEMAREHADEWFRLMGTRIKGTKDGVEVVYTWTDGFYAVKYTDKNTMMIDGNDLQNCLRAGNYWDEVKKGTNIVYGIRNPSDQAVVGIRVRRYSKAAPILSLVECKGKNNKPVSPIYRPYVIDFLNFLKVDGGDVDDLEKADIHFNNGKYGTFTDTASLVYDKGGLKVWKGDQRALAQYGKNNEADISYRTGNIIGFNASQRMPVKIILVVLNALKIPPAKNVIDSLQAQGIAYDSTAKAYMPLETAGTVLGEYDGLKAISLGHRYLLLRDGKVAYQADLQTSKKIGSVTVVDESISEEDIIKFLNMIKLMPSDDMAIFFAKKMDVGYNGAVYGKLDDVMTALDTKNDATLYRAGESRYWLVKDSADDGVVVVYGVNSMNIHGLSSTSDEEDILILVRRLLKKEMFTSFSSPAAAEILGIIGLPKSKSTKATVAVDIDDIFTNIKGVAQTQTINSNGLPYVHMSKELQKFIETNRYSFGNSIMPDNAGELLAKSMIPKDKVSFRMLRTRSVFDIQVVEYEIAFPMAALEICFAIEGGGDLPEILSKALQLGATQALKRITGRPNHDLFFFDKTPFERGDNDTSLKLITRWLSREARDAIDTLSINVSNHNSSIERVLRDKLKAAAENKEVSLSDRFAAMNLQRMLQDKDRR